MLGRSLIVRVRRRGFMSMAVPVLVGMSVVMLVGATVFVRRSILGRLGLWMMLREVTVMVVAKPVVEPNMGAWRQLEPDHPQDGGEQCSKAAVGPLARCRSRSHEQDGEADQG